MTDGSSTAMGTATSLPSTRKPSAMPRGTGTQPDGGLHHHVGDLQERAQGRMIPFPSVSATPNTRCASSRAPARSWRLETRRKGTLCREPRLRLSSAHPPWQALPSLLPGRW